MAIVFQYGSNMSVDRLNSADRLSGDATPIGVARTVENYDLAFTVWSKKNNCAAADIAPGRGRSIYGVLYQIPNDLLSRETAKTIDRRSLDEIEGEGTNYVRTTIQVLKADETFLTAITYVAKHRQPNLATSDAYVRHILRGLKEHNLPNEYRQYVCSRIVNNNGSLQGALERMTSE